MVRSYRWLITTALVLASPAPSAAQAAGADLVARLDSVFSTYAGPRPGCAVGLTARGGPIVVQGYGLAVLEHDVPIGRETVFHAASVAKPMTAFVVLQLVVEGRLSLDDHVRKHLPELPDYERPLTIRHLLTQTSGLRDQWVLARLAGWREGEPIGQADILRLVFAQHSTDFVPGSRWAYSNSNFTLLAEIAERLTGRTFPELARARVFEPLGMTRTRFLANDLAVVEHRATGYEATDGGWMIAPPRFDNYGATNLLTTAGDLVRWGRNLWTRRVAPAAVDSLLRARAVLNDGTVVEGYGYGMAFGRPGDLAAVGHNGSDAGFTADVLAFPGERVAAATLCNATSALAYDLNPAAARRLLADRWKPPVEDVAAAESGSTEAEADGEPVAGSPIDPDPFVGRYHSPELDVTWTLERQGSDLVLHRHRFEPVRLRPAGESGRLTWGRGVYELSLDANGRSLTVDHPRATGIRFERVRVPPE